MGTDEIERVDAVFYERFFGDLSFKGILAVYTKNKSLAWVESAPGVGHFRYLCLQPVRNWKFSNKRNTNTHVPDFNKVLYRESISEITPRKEFGFNTSDISGDVVIRVIVVNKNHQVLYGSKLIKVE
jgi:hypothetical protein